MHLIATASLNTGDMIAQLIMVCIILAIITGIILLIFVFRNRNNRLKRVEDKLDKILEENENKN
ncbi:DUF4083 family protein [Tenuibacillus multivorans]|uniref:DUF4083 domain-containing protein n=1 Tax=Tenuibacillus multivorans TaxID=237069 RepID=A0A1G9Z3U1_9BACI|nr:DUF4083 family protein [Tenuibacillus multivorans]GEL77425.1 hypothetical protein TMU01_16600 [Tenuibacillus multivorans]SDN15877.1 protein of unknown function [Tenuibacillus multivorans]